MKRVAIELKVRSEQFCVTDGWTCPGLTPSTLNTLGHYCEFFNKQKILSNEHWRPIRCKQCHEAEL